MEYEKIEDLPLEELDSDQLKWLASQPLRGFSNEELAASRRYVLIRVSEEGVIVRVKVVTGDILAPLDATGTLTQKYQARFADTVTERLL